MTIFKKGMFAEKRKIPLRKEAVIVIDTNLIVMSFNNEAREVMGAALKHGKILSFDSFIRPKDLSVVKNAIKEGIKGVVRNKISVQVKTIAGQPLSIMLSISPLYSDRKTIHSAVLSFKKTEDRNDSILTNPSFIEHKALLEALPEGIFTINTKWQIAFFNKTAEQITGYTKQEVLGRYCWEVFEADICELGCPLKDALETGKNGMQQDIRILKKEKTSQTILVNVGVLRDGQGLIVGAIETFRTLTGGITPSKNLKKSHSFSDIIGKSKAIKQLFQALPDIAASEANVLLTGESGTGKELFARSIHNNSSRAKHPFVAVNCAALAENLLESELFGHEKSAFTGATKTKLGRFELVKKGTLFLDEIGELKPSQQIKLLRVLEQREFERVGGTIPIPLEARIISATNKDISHALEDGSFRTDFYYRLRTVPIVIPPLRKRKNDIPLLVNFFIRDFNRTFNKKVKKVDDTVMEIFLNYDWPGNIRELEHAIEYAFVFVKGPVILPENLPQLDFSAKKVLPEPSLGSRKHLTRETIVQALKKSNGKKNQAAVLLGISRTSLWRKMKKFNLIA